MDYESKILKNIDYFKQLHTSMDCALHKAENGSPVEDGYYLEKLSKAAAVFGFKLTADD